MKKIIFVRYGEKENGQLSQKGIETMTLTAEKLKPIIQNQNTHIICADIDRAISSAEIISKHLNILFVKNFSELYASDEKNIFPNIEIATEIINLEGKKCDILIAVISREYIETLPNYILKTLGSKEIVETHLNRGEALILDYDMKGILFNN